MKLTITQMMLMGNITSQITKFGMMLKTMVKGKETMDHTIVHASHNTW